ncbi:MAG TPA: outer membrane beta-barrel protein [Steroidobacteraceae bacterium]|nr:outer membrane beta-barrel protein [Steroidobacteraceae bacterium]
MKRISGTLLAILSVGACAASTAALAENPVGFYLGAGVGYSTIRSDDSAYGLPGYYNDHQTAWKAIAGVRPIPIIGAEFEYIDFGQPGHHYGYNSFNQYGFDSHPRASALFGVGYLPLPVPFFDVFGKAGVARLQTDVTTVTGSVTCPGPGGTGCVPLSISRQNQTDNKFAYGVGLQSKAWGVSFRAEYERISSQFGDPDALTVSATWTF